MTAQERLEATAWAGPSRRVSTTRTTRGSLRQPCHEFRAQTVIHMDDLQQYRRREKTTVTVVQVGLDTEGFTYQKWGGTHV